MFLKLLLPVCYVIEPIETEIFKILFFKYCIDFGGHRSRSNVSIKFYPLHYLLLHLLSFYFFHYICGLVFTQQSYIPLDIFMTCRYMLIPH